MRFSRRDPPPGPHGDSTRRYANYKQYKPYLREDFQQRCAYCQFHEGHPDFGGPDNFGVDHFLPLAQAAASQRSRDDLETDYSNLCYACEHCNTAKHDTWPSQEQIARGFRFIGPCQEDLLQDHSTLDAKTGHLLPLTEAGRYTIAAINLNRQIFRKLRLRLHNAPAEINRLRELANELGRRSDPLNIKACDELRRRADELDRTYLNPESPDFTA